VIGGDDLTGNIRPMSSSLVLPTNEKCGSASPRSLRYWLLTLTACILLAVFWMPRHTTRWVPDESWYTIPAQALLDEGRIRNTTFPESDWEEKADVRPPAMPLTLAAGIRIFGLGITQTRALSLAAALLTVILVYFLGVELSGSAAGAIAATITATDTFFFLAARTVRPEIYVALFSTLALLFFLKSRHTQSVLLAFAAGSAAAIAVSYHVNGAGIVLAIGALLLVDHRWRVLVRKQAWAFGAGLLLTLAPTIWWIASDAAHRAAFRQIYLGRAIQPFGDRVVGEAIRYSDFLGIGSWRLGFSIGHIPLRAHLVLIFAISAVILMWRFRSAAILILVPLAANMAFWILLVNKSSRYFAITAPLFALTTACAAVIVWSMPRWVRICAAAAVSLLVISGILGNIVLLHQSRRANYDQTALLLRQAIPAGESAMGSISFWMALHDRQYYSYDRTPLEYIIRKHAAHYFILNDRVMARGSGYGEDDFADLRANVYPFVKEKGTLVARIPSDYYGDLQVYRVRYE
jgi:4-amino-4-deoxy-L-arabinose transferase-like glycosyltransferase